MTTALRAPATDADWATYHAIRRRVLFELRGNGAAYDANHPDDQRPENHPLVFWHESEIVGVMRVDVDGITALVRRVAVRDDVQRRGHGRRMLASAEQFAGTLGCTRMESHVDPSAVGFYERCGFLCDDAFAKGTGAVLMTKRLAGYSQE